MNRQVFLFKLKMINYLLRSVNSWLDGLGEPPQQPNRDEVFEFLQLANYSLGLDIHVARLEGKIAGQHELAEGIEEQTTPSVVTH